MLQIISCNMPSGMGTKLEFLFFFYFIFLFFLPHKLFIESSKTAYIKEIILCKGNSRLNIIQNIYTFQVG